MASGFTLGNNIMNGGNSSQFYTAADPSMDESLTTTTIPTTAKPTDPYAYEHNVFHERINDHDLEIMKDHLRLIHGLPTFHDLKKRKVIDRNLPPKEPRTTITSQRRHELMRHKLIVRCTGFIEMIENYNKLLEHDDPKYFIQLRDEAMNKTNEQLEYEFELQEFTNLKILAERAKASGKWPIRDNIVSEMRLRNSRGEPIISNMFKEHYLDYRKPPYSTIPKHVKMRSQYLPKINYEKEIWLIPVDDEDSGLTPMNIITSTTRDPKNKKTKREEARPPIRKKKNIQAKTEEKEGSKVEVEGYKKDIKNKKSRRPWVYARMNAC